MSAASNEVAPPEGALPMTGGPLPLELDDDELLLADTLERFCASEKVLERAQHGQGAFDAELWRALSAQGVLELARPDEGTLSLLVAAMEVLGKHAFPGPLSDTVLALSLLGDADDLLAGRTLASVASPPYAPEALGTTLFLEITPEGVFELLARDQARAREGLGAEAWCEAVFVRAGRFEHSTRALLMHDVVLAAQLAGMAQGLVSRTAQHAATRKQFGKPIAAFQAVSHPLASSHIALLAAAQLARAAASAFDEGSGARPLATAALISARRAALEAVYTCHQKLGALGITLEGPAHHVGRRVRSLATRCTARIEHTRELLLEGDLP